MSTPFPEVSPQVVATLRAFDPFVYVRTPDTMLWLKRMDQLLLKHAPRMYVHVGQMGPKFGESPLPGWRSVRDFLLPQTFELVKLERVSFADSLRAAVAKDESMYEGFYFIPSADLLFQKEPDAALPLNHYRMGVEGVDLRTVKTFWLFGEGPCPYSGCTELQDEGPTVAEYRAHLVDLHQRLVGRTVVVPEVDMSLCAGRTMLQVSRAVTAAVIRSKFKQEGFPEVFNALMGGTAPVYPLGSKGT